jgi:hypothetical protein
MTTKRGSLERSRGAIRTPRRKRSAGEAHESDQYEAAFLRVRLWRAWIGTVLAMVVLAITFLALLDRFL